jgi:hypothetical protein
MVKTTIRLTGVDGKPLGTKAATARVQKALQELGYRVRKTKNGLTATIARKKATDGNVKT